MEFLYQDEHFFAIHKPAGHFVHPPERSPYPVPREKICLYTLREHFQREVFPVHRLDAPTSGVTLFAMDRAAARELNFLFSQHQMHKEYEAVVRGYVDDNGTIDLPLEIAGFDELQACETHYQKIQSIELPVAVGKKYSTTRYSLVAVQPVTGRWHQIRRHFDRMGHPLLGDIEHGDSHHNRFFRDHLQISGLCLRARSLSFLHPWNGEQIHIRVSNCDKWTRIHNLFAKPESFLQQK